MPFHNTCRTFDRGLIIINACSVVKNHSTAVCVHYTVCVFQFVDYCPFWCCDLFFMTECNCGRCCCYCCCYVVGYALVVGFSFRRWRLTWWYLWWWWWWWSSSSGRRGCWPRCFRDRRGPTPSDTSSRSADKTADVLYVLLSMLWWYCCVGLFMMYWYYWLLIVWLYFLQGKMVFWGLNRKWFLLFSCVLK